MVSTLSRQEKFDQVRSNFCFYLDIQEHGMARTISKRLQDMEIQQETYLTSRVTHVVRGERPRAAPRWRREPGRARADAMLQRVPREPENANYVLLTVEKAIKLLDKLYETFCTAPRKANVRLFTKHFIKIEFLDKQCRPLYKEFDVWPEISLEPNPLKDKKENKETTQNQGVTVNNNYHNTTQKNEMTRKNRPRIKEKEDAEPRGGYCEACGAEFADLAAHARSPRHAAFARDTNNFLALDNLIGASFLPPINGERRSLRNMCNGDTPVNGTSPRNGTLDDDKRRNTRCRKLTDSQSEDRQYYKVVGVSTKLRSSGGFVTKRKDSSPTCNGAKPLVVKFRKVRRSELSVLSDEAEQFMFPKRASSTSSTSSDDDDEEEPRRKTPPQPAPQLERRRQARPLALKEESSEEDSWLDDKRQRKRRVAPVVRRTRRTPFKEPTPEPTPPPEVKPPTPPPPVPEPEVSPLREEPVEKCMKWEDGKLKYTPAVEQLEFAFECVPRSEPWFETFRRQDQDQVTVKNVPRCFALYSKSPKLPYEIGQLPPLKPDCCPLSALTRREGRAPAEPRGARYGTRGLKVRKLHKRAATLAALDTRPRKSPREHASTLAMLGSAGLRRDDAKSTASDDTTSDALSAKPEPVISETQEASERLQQFLADVFEGDDDLPDSPPPGPPLAPAAPPDVLALISDCDSCDIIRDEIRHAANERSRRRGRFKKKNRTGWPNKRKQKKGSRTNSSEEQKAESSLDRSSAGSGETADTCDDASEPEDDETSTADKNSTTDKTSTAVVKNESETESQDESTDRRGREKSADDKPLRLDVKVLVEDKKEKGKAAKVKGSSSVSESDEKEEKVRKKKRMLTELGSWLQPVVRVARVDPAAARRLRSAAPARAQRLR